MTGATDSNVFWTLSRNLAVIYQEVGTTDSKSHKYNFFSEHIFEYLIIMHNTGLIDKKNIQSCLKIQIRRSMKINI